MQTDRNIHKPDITIRDNEKETCMLIDVAILGDGNVIKEIVEKILKYKHVTTETERKWNVKANVISVIIGANGTISKSFRKYLNNIPKKHEINELQKNSHIGHFTHTS